MEKILNYANFCASKFQLPVQMLSFHRTIEAIEGYNLNLDEIKLIPLMGYTDFIKAQQESKFIISDSGTAQEEPSLLDIPVIVPRDFTERPESVENNCSFMMNLDTQNYKTTSIEWLKLNRPILTKWLGNGNTSRTIVEHLRALL